MDYTVVNQTTNRVLFDRTYSSYVKKNASTIPWKYSISTCALNVTNVEKNSILVCRLTRSSNTSAELTDDCRHDDDYYDDMDHGTETHSSTNNSDPVYLLKVNVRYK